MPFTLIIIELYFENLKTFQRLMSLQYILY